jgi:hypothetical protein
MSTSASAALCPAAGVVQFRRPIELVKAFGSVVRAEESDDAKGFLKCRCTAGQN